MIESLFNSLLLSNVLLLCCGVALVAVWVTFFARALLIKKGIMDIPNARSNHKYPVARGSGIALLTVALTALCYVGWPWQVVFIAGILTASFFVDDVRGLPRRVRFFLQLGAVVIGLYFMPMPFETPLYLYSMIALLFVSWVWFINLFNFMDGIDGITAMQTISMSIGMMLVAALTPTMPTWFVPGMAVLAAAAIGYIKWNWQPAKVFLGDSGSIPLGFLLGFSLILLALHGHYASVLLICGYYGGDATLTILKRLLRGEKIWKAHSEHAYQLAVRQRGLSHAQVVLRITALNILLNILAVVAMSGGVYMWGSLVVGALLVLGLYFWFSSKKGSTQHGAA